MTANSVPVMALVVLVTVSGTLAIARLVESAQRRRAASGEAPLGAGTRVPGIATAWPAALVALAAIASDGAALVALFALLSALTLRGWFAFDADSRGAGAWTRTACYLSIPLQYTFVAAGSYSLIALCLPLAATLGLPLLAVLDGDTRNLAERTARRYFGVMVCVYGLSHAPALLLLATPATAGRAGLLVVFMVLVAQLATLLDGTLGRLAARHGGQGVLRNIGMLAAATLLAGGVGAALAWLTPYGPETAAGMALLTGAAAALGTRVMAAFAADLAHTGERANDGLGVLPGRLAAIAFAAPTFFHLARTLQAA
jgi:phosphatidate cytidylyltransferase